MKPVIILEGPNGVGKTTYALELSKAFDVPIIRPLRSVGGSQWGEGELQAYRDMGVPVNTFVDDIYCADFIAKTSGGAILDRSMPSALVYANTCDQLGHIPTYEHLYWWQSKLAECGGKVLVVFLQSSLAAVKARDHVRKPEAIEFSRLTSRYSKIFHQIALPKMIISTHTVDVAKGVAMIERKINGDAG